MTTVAAEGEAPGRLDVLGGVADYSGGLVLQTPIRDTTRVRVTARDEPWIKVASVGREPVTVPATAVGVGDARAGRAWLDEHRVPAWARYPLGCLMLFCGWSGWRPATGLAIEIRSDVPTSMGVSSSAALEVATLRALERLAGRSFEGTALARVAQRVENEMVGSPCGLMDQLTAAHGIPGTLLPILCRPDVLLPPVSLPPGIVVAGWPSGVAHAVSGSPYGTARTAAFMAKAILERHCSRRLAHLTELDPSIVAGVDDGVLPAAMTGRAFMRLHGGIDDPLSRVEADRVYPVRAAGEFATGEHVRAGLAVRLLRDAPAAAAVAVAEKVGELMHQSHRGYSSIGLGSPETDAMVAEVRRRGPEQGFFGARVSGGGCGGTVAVLASADALPTLRRIAAGLTGGTIIPACMSAAEGSPSADV